jgi:hypothetical protein
VNKTAYHRRRSRKVFTNAEIFVKEDLTAAAYAAYKESLPLFVFWEQVPILVILTEKI